MVARIDHRQAERNVQLYPWFKAFQSLLFWQAVWFLFFQNTLSAAEAILLYAIFDLSTTVLEVPSGYLSDRVGRRPTLILAGLTGLAGASLLTLGHGFAVFALAQVCLGASQAFVSGTDSSLLFESLDRAGRSADVEAEEVKAWRFGFVAFAVSAAVGGALGMFDPRLPFAATVFAMAGMLAIAIGFHEPGKNGQVVTERMRFRSLLHAFDQPVVRWMFVLSFSMYAFSHIPFVFGQPFILQALATVGLEAEAPLVSGTLTSVMMLISVGVSLFARKLRKAIGLPAILLLAFGIQIALIAVLSLTDSIFAVLVLLLRMVPNSLAGPFILARLQPLLGDETRATYLSTQSLVGRLVLATSLLFASGVTSDQGTMVHAEISVILGWYVAAGLLVIGGLIVAARRITVEG
ncbi:MFS transporter [Phaeobacter marinintestinus]|uniref:MFS transporter n=1 Tax=Falsiphaeobacter marinintestinus TaxID=1492905 RepID=UPI0011B69E96|nr:MFS transporter [Phaeobacter marinintestinus]